MKEALEVDLVKSVESGWVALGSRVFRNSLVNDGIIVEF